MQPFFEEYLDRLEELHDDVRRTIAGLPQEALDWAPGLDMNSLGVLAVHLAGAERYWIGDVVGRDLSGRDRDAEFRARGLGAAALSERLNGAEAFSNPVSERNLPRDTELEVGSSGKS